MNSYFLVALALMTIMAIAFLMQPLWRRSEISDSQSRIPYFAITFLVPSIAIGLYAYLGEPQAAVATTTTQRPAMSLSSMTGRTQAQQGNLDSVANLIDGLAARLEQNPDDAGGWLLLAKSYKHLDNPDGAGEAYRQAVALGKTDADLESYLSSTAAVAAPFSGIQGRVTIADDKIDSVDDAATVFVTARATSGSPVPLAVLRTTVATLPFDFNLHDGQAMVAGNNLSSADSVIVSAKISADGDALNTLPGFEVHSEPVATKNPEFVSLQLGQ